MSAALYHTVEILPSKSYIDRLYWITGETPPKSSRAAYYFCVDEVRGRQDITYEAFCEDFGPVNLAITYRFCREVEKVIGSREFADGNVYQYTKNDPKTMTNSAYLMGAFQVLVLGKTAAEAVSPFLSIPEILPFRDASVGPSMHSCTLMHCLSALETATRLHWFNMKTFDVTTYEKYEQVAHGDLNWIIPNKLLAFRSPSKAAEPSSHSLPPESYVPILTQFHINTVIRLNSPEYDSTVSTMQRFTRFGVKHFDVFLPDGSVPGKEAIEKFLRIVEREKGPVAVHCKAGLGRTATLIGVYALKHYAISAVDYIAWSRICRPGSVLGPQQPFLIDFEQKLKKKAENVDCAAQKKDCLTVSTLSASFEDPKANVSFEIGQAERLLSVKKHLSASIAPYLYSHITAKPHIIQRPRSLIPISPNVKKGLNKTVFMTEKGKEGRNARRVRTIKELNRAMA